MGIIIDTSIWVDVERGRLTPADISAVTSDEPVYLAPPVIAELEYGVHRAKSAAQKNKRASALARIRKCPCLILDQDTGVTFGRIAADLDTTGRPSKYKVQHVWLAALALQHNLGVLTQNKKDFDGIPGLRVLSMSKK